MPDKKRRALWEALLEGADLLPPELWPKPSGDFDIMSRRLEQTVGCAVTEFTWNKSSIEDWAWDPYEQQFHFYVVSWIPKLGGDGFPLSVKRRFAFDPMLEWHTAVTDLVKEVSAYAESLKKLVS